jgi:hypothetical protein
MGWNLGQPSQLVVQLVEDDRAGDSFSATAADVGTPFLFQHEGFQFRGLLQRYTKSVAIDGNPTYEAVLVDPREVLEGARVILGGYSGPTSGVPNLLNVYGYWESQGYGLSGSNESGMPWGRLVYGLQGLVGTPGQTAYGGPLSYRGATYGVDLSEMPALPEDYRVGGSAVGLLELIAQACDDGGCDFFVELDGYVIRIKTHSRRLPPPLGTVQYYVDASLGATVSRAQVGVEARHEQTSSFLVGGQQQRLYMADAFSSFWGVDQQGSPIVGLPGEFLIRQNVGGVKGVPPGVALKSVPCEFVSLLLPPELVAALGAEVYPSSTLEMRMAKAGFDSWATFMEHCRPDWAGQLGLVGAFGNQGAVNNLLKPNLVNDQPDNAAAWVGMVKEFARGANSMRLFEFVKSYADAYMGRKFLVPLPFVNFRQDPSTLVVSRDWDVSDGGYLEEGSAPLGLSQANEDLFKTQDGRFRAFAKILDVANIDTTQLGAGTSLYEDADGELFVDCEVDTNMLVYQGRAAVVVTLSSAVFERPQWLFGDLGIVAAVLQLPEDQAQKALGAPQFGNMDVSVHPRHKNPYSVAIPLRSNTLTYGPWFAAGAAGRVSYEQDPSLVPWNYGGYDLMNKVGNARVSESLAQSQLSESGSIEEAGSPSVPLGRALQSGGPLVTGIQVSTGPQGWTTSYSFNTYTPRFGGALSKQAIDRTRKVALATQELRKNLRAAARQSLVRQRVTQAAEVNRAFMENAPKGMRRQSPHDVLVSLVVDDEDAAGNPIQRTGVSACTYEEALAFCNAEGGEYPYGRTVAVSLGALFRPYSKVAGLGVTHYSRTIDGYQASPSGGLTSERLDPFRSRNDVEVCTWGEEYAGLHMFRRETGHSEARPAALRGPLVVAGWGYSHDGNCVPSGATRDSFHPQYLLRPDLWKAGPVDLLWDHPRGVWTCHGSLAGRTVGSVPANGSGQMRVLRLGQESDVITVFNIFSSTVADNTKVVTNYIASDNRNVIVAADCA